MGGWKLREEKVFFFLIGVFLGGGGCGGEGFLGLLVYRLIGGWKWIGEQV